MKILPERQIDFLLMARMVPQSQGRFIAGLSDEEGRGAL